MPISKPRDKNLSGLLPLAANNSLPQRKISSEITASMLSAANPKPKAVVTEVVEEAADEVTEEVTEEITEVIDVTEVTEVTLLTVLATVEIIIHPQVTLNFIIALKNTFVNMITLKNTFVKGQFKNIYYIYNFS